MSSISCFDMTLCKQNRHIMISVDVPDRDFNFSRQGAI